MRETIDTHRHTDRDSLKVDRPSIIRMPSIALEDRGSMRPFLRVSLDGKVKRNEPGFNLCSRTMEDDRGGQIKFKPHAFRTLVGLALTQHLDELSCKVLVAHILKFFRFSSKPEQPGLFSSFH